MHLSVQSDSSPSIKYLLCNCHKNFLEVRERERERERERDGERERERERRGTINFDVFSDFKENFETLSQKPRQVHHFINAH